MCARHDRVPRGRRSRTGRSVRTWDAQGKVCPFLSGAVAVTSSSTPPQYQYTPNTGIGGGTVVIPPSANTSPTSHLVYCRADQCMAWIGDNNHGRCGLTRITDAEAMKYFLGGKT